MTNFIKPGLSFFPKHGRRMIFILGLILPLLSTNLSCRPDSNTVTPTSQADTINPIVNTAYASNEHQEQSVRHALLIGINRYKNATLTSLPGTENDLKLAHEVLTKKFGFMPENIRELKNEDATRRGILDELHQLVKSAVPGDIVYIHYSGHGSQVKDKNGDEKDDQKDETLVPHDGRTEGIADITDDELNSILSKLKTSHAVVVLDSCHSGTATRGVTVGIRAIPEDTRLELYPKNQVLTRGTTFLPSKRYILLAAAAAQQVALDVPVDDTYYGAFSYSFFNSLKNISFNASAQEALKKVEAELKKIQKQLERNSMPEPQLEGPEHHLRQPLFPPPGEQPRLLWVEAKKIDHVHVRLLQAKLQGGLPGSYWALYHEDAIEFAPGKELAHALVEKNEGDSAVAKIKKILGKGAIPATTRAVQYASPPPTPTVIVRVRDASPNIREKLTMALGQQGIHVVDQNNFAPIVVDATADLIHIFGADGASEIDSFPITSINLAIDSLTKRLHRTSIVSQFEALNNPSTDITLDVDVAHEKPQIFQEENRTRGMKVTANLDRPIYKFRHQNQPRNSTNSLQLKIFVDKKVYLTVVDIDSEGNANLLFPNAYSEENNFYPKGQVEGNETVLLPDSLERGNESGFNWDYGPPAGEDTIRVFASTDLKTAKTIRNIVGNSTINTRATSRGEASATLSNLHRELAQGRGVITVPNPQGDSHFVTADWTATSVTIEVEP